LNSRYTLMEYLKRVQYSKTNEREVRI
jgi:hypothetical protein